MMLSGHMSSSFFLVGGPWPGLERLSPLVASCLPLLPFSLLLSFYLGVVEGLSESREQTSRNGR